MWSAGTIDMALQEPMHGDVPLSREIKPVGRVPPVGIEVPIGKTGNFGEGAKDIFKDNKKHEEKSHHEREEE